jgi:hypothetical protein
VTPTINGETNHLLPAAQLHNIGVTNFYTLQDLSVVCGAAIKIE